jgi:hypothetical protein
MLFIVVLTSYRTATQIGTVAKGSNVINAAFHKQSIYGHVLILF